MCSLPYTRIRTWLTCVEQSKIAADYDRRFAKFLGEVKAEVQGNSDFIGIKKGGRLLDYACGTGFLSEVCAALHLAVCLCSLTNLTLFPEIIVLLRCH